MFTKLLQALKEKRRTIVFTEGPDARILEAASRLIADDLMDVILLGGEAIGTVDKEATFWATCYRIEAFSKSNVNLVVAVAAVVEAIKKADERSN